MTRPYLNLSPDLRVMRYMSKHSTSDLKFSASADTSILESKDVSLRGKVLTVLQEAYERPTYYAESSRFQCRAGSRRSALDIYRVIKHYSKNEVSLQEVMRTLFRLVNKHDSRISSSYCMDVRKRVFTRWGNFVYDVDDLDEFGITFHDWESINEVDT